MLFWQSKLNSPIFKVAAAIRETSGIFFSFEIRAMVKTQREMPSLTKRRSSIFGKDLIWLWVGVISLLCMRCEPSRFYIDNISPLPPYPHPHPLPHKWKGNTKEVSSDRGMIEEDCPIFLATRFFYNPFSFPVHLLLGRASSLHVVREQRNKVG